MMDVDGVDASLGCSPNAEPSNNTKKPKKSKKVFCGFVHNFSM
jgi:hypothetical protein